MQIEVPPEQYHDVVDKLEKPINGRVQGITDARQAKRIIRKGHYSYESAVKMCKAGKVAGLRYDARTGLVGAGLAGSMSFAIAMATGDWRDGKVQQTLKVSARQAVVGGGTALGTHVATAQLSRLGATKAMRPLADAAIKKLPATVTRQLATGAGGKALSGAAAGSHLSKVARCNALSIGVVGAIDMAKSARQLADGKISGVQVAHNTARSAAGMAAGSVGWTAGSALGASIGSVVPGLGTAVGYFVGGMCGALSGGKAGSYAAGRMATGTIGPDDNAFVETVSQRVLEALLTKHDLSDIAVHNVQQAMMAVDRRTLLQDRNGAFRVLQKAAVAAL